MIDLLGYDTDKSPAYLANYEREFGDRFEQPIKLLEMGIQRGGSMLLWLDLLPSAEIAGLDLNEVALPTHSRLHVYQGFQQDAAILDQIASEVAPDGFDVIVDDASHLGRYTAESFWHLFPRHLKPGGVYVIDDWGSGYWSDWADGHRYEGSREALGDFSNATVTAPGSLELARRRVRSSARPLAARLNPKARSTFEKIYMRIEGVSLQHRFASHDYGMVGFIKQLVDACGVDDIDRHHGSFDSSIASIHTYPSQVFVHKRHLTPCDLST
jgi:SAM-dependent methyltransferase